MTNEYIFKNSETLQSHPFPEQLSKPLTLPVNNTNCLQAYISLKIMLVIFVILGNKWLPERNLTEKGQSIILPGAGR